MTTLEFGAPTKTAEDFNVEIRELLGCEPPIKIVMEGGLLKQVSVETEWKEGGTTPVEGEVEVEKTILNDDGETETITETEIRVVDYEENYEHKALTPAQVTALETYIQNNLEQQKGTYHGMVTTK